MIKPDYLYIKEIGVDIRIRGVMNLYSVMLTDCFETEEDAANFLREHGWIYDKQTKKWYNPENAKRTLENEASTVASASDYQLGCMHMRDLIIANIIGIQNNMQPQSEAYQALQKLLLHIEDAYGGYAQKYKG